MMTISVNSAAGAKGNEVNFVTDADGNVTGLRDADGRANIVTPALDGTWRIKSVMGQSGIELFGPNSGVTPTVSHGAGLTVNSSGAAMDAHGDAVFNVNATATSGTNNYFEISIPAFDALTSNAVTLEYWSNPAKLGTVALYIGTASYAVYALRNSSNSAPNNSDPFYHLGLSSIQINDSEWTKSGYSGNASDQAWVQAKVRVYVTNGETVDFALRSVRAATVRGKGRICVTADDGYASWLRLGVPIFEEFGIKTVSGIIVDKIGTSATYPTLAEWQKYVGRGHECVAHGPNGGNGNLVDNYTTNAERIADINTHRDYLLANGLTTTKGAKCYIFPQGAYAPTAGDVSLLDAMRAEGYVLARTATAKTSRFINLNALSALAHTRMLMPIIGHSYAGVANTADDATETANIAAIVASIQALGSQRRDGFIMLHKVGARGAGGSLTIEADRLCTLASAIRAQIDAGTLEAVVMSELIEGS